MTTRTAHQLISFGRLCFAVGLIAWGTQHLVAGDFVTRVVPSWPDWLPPRTLWAYLTGALLISCGVAIGLQVQGQAAARAFSVMALASFALLHLPLVARDGILGGAWTSAGKALVMCGGALLVALSLSGTAEGSGHASFARSRVHDAIVVWGRLCLGGFMTLCGIQHFLYVPFVASLIPAWIPGAVFWTYFAGVALVAGGIGIIVPQVARLAAVLAGAMIFSWVFLVHVPLVLRDPHNAGNVAAVFEALAFSGVAFLLAGLAPPRART